MTRQRVRIGELLVFLGLCVSVVAQAQNLAENAGFEDQLTGWTASPGSAVFTADGSVVRSGGFSAKGVETDPGSLGRLYQDVTLMLTVGDTYRLTGWLKTENVTGGAGATLALDWVNADGATVAGGSVIGLGFVTGTSDWTYFEGGPTVLFESPPGAVGVAITLDFSAASGTAWWDDVLLERFDDQALDPEFGADGLVTTDFGGGAVDDGLRGLLQPDGKVVVVGSSTLADDDFALARYEMDGSLDTSFGTGGLVTTDLDVGSFDVAWGGQLQPDGKIVATGLYIDDVTFEFDFALARYETDGTLDPGFGSGGIVIVDLGGGSSDVAFGVALQPDGKIVVTGRSDLAGDTDFAIARFLTSGALDTTFGTGGVVTTGFGAGSWDSTSGAAVIQPDGRILVAGRTSSDGTPSGASDLALARYEEDGDLDTTFGTGGTVVTDVSGGSDDRAGGGPVLQDDGRILLAGYSDAGGDQDFVAARYGSTGSLDASFAIGGLAVLDLGNDDLAQGEPSLQPDGKIVLSGFTGTFVSGLENGDFAVVRLDTDGALDTGFWTTGIVTTDFGGGSNDLARDSLIRSDGGIVVVGTSDTSADLDFALATYRLTGIFADDFESGDTSAWTSSVP